MHIRSRAGQRMQLHVHMMVKSIHINIRAFQVSCGSAHTIARTSDGQIYAWGRGWAGQLGHNNTKDSLSPTFVEVLKVCVYVCVCVFVFVCVCVCV